MACYARRCGQHWRRTFCCLAWPAACLAGGVGGVIRITDANPSWHKASQDVACALSWLGAKAASYGGDPYQLPQRLQAVSSYSYLSAQAPPTLMLSPQQDGLVPAWSVQRFAHYARLAGVNVELVAIPFANHVYNQLAANSAGNQLRRSVTLRYLRQQGLVFDNAAAGEEQNTTK